MHSTSAVLCLCTDVPTTTATTAAIITTTGTTNPQPASRNSDAPPKLATSWLSSQNYILAANKIFTINVICRVNVQQRVVWEDGGGRQVWKLQQRLTGGWPSPIHCARPQPSSVMHTPLIWQRSRQSAHNRRSKPSMKIISVTERQFDAAIQNGMWKILSLISTTPCVAIN